jgi:hypothetical protein
MYLSYITRTTSMHRLQVSLPKSQVDFLAERARREGVSIAELVRRLVEHAAASRSPGATTSLWTIAEIADDPAPLFDGLPVSECPDPYLAAAALPKAVAQTKRQAARAKARLAKPR